MGDRRHIANRGDRKPNRLQRTQCGFAPGTGPFDLDVEGAHAMLHRLASGVLGSDLRSIRGRFSRPFETLAARRGPRDRIALGIRDRDHRVVERGVHMGRARCDVLTFAPAQPRRRCRRSRHVFLSAGWFEPWPLFLLAGDRPGRTLARPRVRMGALAPHRQPLAVTQPAVAPEIHQSLDVHRYLPPEVALDRVFTINQLADAQNLVIGHLVHAPLDRNADPAADLERLGPPDAVDVGQPDRDPLLIRNVHASDPRHLRFSSKEQRCRLLRTFARASSINIAPVASTPTGAQSAADGPTPQPRRGWAVVRIRAASVNPSDVKNVEGQMERTVLPRVPRGRAVAQAEPARPRPGGSVGVTFVVGWLGLADYAVLRKARTS